MVVREDAQLFNTDAQHRVNKVILQFPKIQQSDTCQVNVMSGSRHVRRSPSCSFIYIISIIKQTCRRCLCLSRKDILKNCFKLLYLVVADLIWIGSEHVLQTHNIQTYNSLCCLFTFIPTNMNVNRKQSAIIEGWLALLWLISVVIVLWVQLLPCSCIFFGFIFPGKKLYRSEHSS